MSKKQLIEHYQNTILKRKLYEKDKNPKDFKKFWERFNKYLENRQKTIDEV